MASARVEDINGYMRVNDNPLSKVGVFPYLGKSISSELNPDEIYYVYRPAEELSDPETINSFKNIPWIDDHTMLGSKYDGLTPAEEKGVQGVIGEEVYFEHPYLKGNLVVFSESLRDIIDSGKKELSCGYRCDYKRQSGTFEGQRYDFIQTDIRGNHLATVDEGRMGREVAVMDSFTFDSKDLIMDQKADNQATGLDESMMDNLKAAMTDMMPGIMKDALPAMMKDMLPKLMKDAMHEGGEEPEGEDATEKDGDVEDKKDEEVEDKKEEKKGEGMDSNVLSELAQQVKALNQEIATIKGSAMDSKSVLIEMNQRTELANKLTPFIGAFDHSEMTLQDVQKYGCEKIGLDATEGMEGAVLAGYLHGRQPAQSYPVHAQDAADQSANPVDQFIQGA